MAPHIADIVDSYSLGQLCYAAAGIGVLAHIGVFMHGEWHMQASFVFGLHIFLAISLFAITQYVEHDYLQSLQWAVCIFTSYAAGLFTSIIAYRISPWHRLAKFPGPRMARVSKFWHVWQCRDARNHEVMMRMRREYGDFVRIGPSEVACFHPDTFSVLESSTTKTTKSDFYDLLLPDFSLWSTRNKSVHDSRRAIWSKALGTNAISTYRDRIDRQVQTLMKYIATAAEEQRSVVANEVLYWYTFDQMGEFAFNKSFGMMEHQSFHFTYSLFRNALALMGPLISVVWLLKIAFVWFPWVKQVKDWFNMQKFCMQQMEKRVQMKPKERDISTYLIEEAHKNGYHKYDQDWLRGDAILVIVAGSDTTASTLTFLFYCLAKHTKDTEKVYQEVKDIDCFDMNLIAALPHLNGVVNEVLRLYPAATTMIVRDPPSEGTVIGGQYIPPATRMLTSRWVTHRHEDAFVHPNAFIPERWSDKPELVKHKEAYGPFSSGRTGCVGQGLAMTTLRLVLANAVKQFHINFAPGEDGTTILNEFRDTLTGHPGKLRLSFSKRVQAGQRNHI